MVDIINNLISSDEIQEVLEWFENDKSVDDRGDTRFKRLDTSSGVIGPAHVFRNFLNRAITDYEPVIEKIFILESRVFSVKLHVDTDENDPKNWGKNFLIPLYFEGPADTIWFKNYWYGIANARFMRKISSPYEYQLKDDDNNWYLFEDVRELTEQKEGTIYYKDGHRFTIDKVFLELIDNIINNRPKEYSPRTDRYDEIINYDPSKKFDSIIQQEYMNHIPIENLHGLTLDRIIDWKLGETYAWDRSQIHAASSRHSYKIGLSIFVNKKV